MISLSRQKDPRTKESIVNPKQRAKLRILAELDRQKHGKWPAFTTDEIDHEDWLLPVGEQNEINGWMYIAQAVRTTDLLASRAYYEYQSFNNQMIINLYIVEHHNRSFDSFEIEHLLTRFTNFMRYTYFVLLLNHLMDDVYDQYEDLESVELLEMTIHNWSISWIGMQIPWHTIHETIADSLVDGTAIFYDLLAKKVEDSGIYLLSEKYKNLAWLKDKIATII
jgi:hypothetical protein